MKETVYKAIFYSTYKDFSLLIKNILMVLEAGDFLTLVGSTQDLIREKPRQASDMASPGAYCEGRLYKLSAPGASQHLDLSNQQPRLRFFSAAQGECPALVTMSHLEDLVLIVH